MHALAKVVNNSNDLNSVFIATEQKVTGFILGVYGVAGAYAKPAIGYNVTTFWGCVRYVEMARLKTH